jgi:tRNA (guanosine-2'-O-)-methyltransferase
VTRPGKKPAAHRPMQGGGERYEKDARKPPAPEDLILDARKERIEAVLDGRTRNLCVVLDRLEDSFNMAAVLRTSEAYGIQDIHVVKNPEYPWSPNHTVTQGCDKWLDLHRHDDWAACHRALKGAGFKIYVSAVREGARSLFDLDFSGRCAVVFGNERHGVSDEVLAGADEVFWIPMRGFTRSLNISAAASAALTRAVAWRKERLGVEGDLTDVERAALRARFLELSVKQRRKLYG